MKMKNQLYLLPLLILFISACGSNSEKKPIAKVKSIKKEETKDTVALIPQSGLKIRYSKYQAERTYTAEVSEDNPENEYEELGTFTAHRKVKLIEIELNDKTVENKINAAIFKAVTAKKMGSYSLQKYVNEVKSLASVEECFDEETTCSLYDSTLNYISIGINQYSMYYGAAHPNSGIQVLNFDLKTGALISLNDLFSPGSRKDLKKIVEKAFIKAWGGEDWDFTPRSGDFNLSENFSLERDGLHFYYNQYEIGPYAMGAPDVIISWKELTKLLKENPYK